MRPLLTTLILLTVCSTARPAYGQQTGREAVVGYAVSFRVMNELMDVIDAAHAFYRTNGNWPADSTALALFSASQADHTASVDSSKYRKLNFIPSGADSLTITFRLTPHTLALDEQEGGTTVTLDSAAGRIVIDPFSPDSASVRIDLDELRFTTEQNPPLHGDLSGAALDFKIGPPQ